ncbi:MAG: endolytic transglycosylase MltG [Candidatus Magasanikbacteria bacterium]|nr:endolytic transglycosylase MltG [Candidatus Magasanikbacteria bacterium]
MFFNRKVFLAAIFFFIVVPFGVWKLYRHKYPAYVPLPPRAEVTLTIIPGWNLRQVADYLVKVGVVSTTDDIYDVTGRPAVDYSNIKTRPFNTELMEGYFPGSVQNGASYEGYLAPETYRVFRGARVEEVVDKLMAERKKQITPQILEAIKQSGKTVHEILTMASILEEEAKALPDRRLVADILWRRKSKNWALQVDSSVHYAADKTGTVFTSDKERAVDSLWNTYKYPGLPPGPISAPSVESIQAALYPEKNNYWYFLSGTDGKMHYAKTLEEHNLNRAKYLR